MGEGREAREGGEDAPAETKEEAAPEEGVDIGREVMNLGREKLKTGVKGFSPITKPYKPASYNFIWGGGVRVAFL